MTDVGETPVIALADRSASPVAPDQRGELTTNGIWVKAHVLLDPGETADTLKETADRLDEHTSLIKRVSVGPTVADGPP